jgi:hypothetical protein
MFETKIAQLLNNNYNLLIRQFAKTLNVRLLRIINLLTKTSIIS